MAKIQDFDQMMWSLPRQTTHDVLSRRIAALFPISLSNTQASVFFGRQIVPKPKGLNKLIRPKAPKEVYSEYWIQNGKNAGRIGDLLAKKSKILESEERKQILIDAFSNGPPSGYATVNYESKIAVSLLFFVKDYEGPLRSDEEYRFDDWKTIFRNTLLNKYALPKKFPFLSTKTLDRAKNMGLAKMFWTIFKMSIDSTESIREYIWVWPDEMGIVFLNAVEDQGERDEKIGWEFLDSFYEEKEKAIRSSDSANIELRKILVNKIKFFGSIVS